MITDSLITDEIWIEAPEEPDAAFLFIALAANARLRQLESDENERGQFSFQEWRRQYVWEIVTVAQELAIKGLPEAENAVKTSESLSDFDAKLARVVTRIKASRRDELRSDTVNLSIKTRTEISAKIEELKVWIDSSNLSDELKERLHKKIEAAAIELSKTRVGMAPIWILAGSFGALVAGTTATLANLPAAIEAVESIVGSINSAKANERDKEITYDLPYLPAAKEPLQISFDSKKQN